MSPDENAKNLAGKMLLALRPDLEKSEVLTVLEVWLRCNEWYVRATAAWTLSRLGEAAKPECVAGLVDRLRDNDARVREVAVGALGSLGSAAAKPDVIRALVGRLKDRNGDVWRAATSALYKILQPRERLFIAPKCRVISVDSLANDKDGI